MFCHKCGNQLPEGAMFCPKCGAKVISEDTVQKPSDTSAEDKATIGYNNDDKYSGAINNQTVQNASSKRSDKRLYDDNIKPYYRKQFERISSGQKPNFNWAAFFLNGWVQLYNGCTAIFSKTFLPLLISIFLVSLLGIVGTLSFNLTLMAITPVLGIVIALGSIVLSVINGFKFNKWYYQDIVSNPGKKRNRKGFWILIIAEIAAITTLFILPNVYKPSYYDLLGDWSDKELFDTQANDDKVNLSEVNINEEYGNSFEYQSSSVDAMDNANDTAINDKRESTTGKYTKGTVTGTSWESEFFGLRYTAPEGMGMSTEEELNELMGLGQEVLSEDFNDLQLKYADLTSVYEMMSVADDQTTNVVVTVEKLMGRMDAYQYVAALEQGLEQVTAINYTLISDDETVKVGNGDYIKVSYQAESSGVYMYQDYYVRVIDDRAIALTLTYMDDRARDNVLNAFTAY